MEETQQLIKNLETELKKDFPDLKYSQQEFFHKDINGTVGLRLRVKEAFYRSLLIDADIAYSDEHAHLNTIVLFSKYDDDAKSLFEKTKEFYSTNKISYKCL